MSVDEASAAEALPTAGLLRAAAGVALDHRPTNDTWNDWSWLAERERMTPSLFEIARSLGSELDESLLDVSANAHALAMAHQVTLEHFLIPAVEVFSTLDIEYRVLKGLATAHLDYASPSMRQFGDVDVLVRPAALRRACEALEQTGWLQPYAIPWGHWDFAHAVTLRNDRGMEIDLHQRAGHRVLGLLMSSDELFDEREEFTVANCGMTALCRKHRLIHASVHAVSSRGEYSRLSSVADVLVIAKIAEPTAEEVLEEASRWGLVKLVEHAIRLSFASAELTLSCEWEEAFAQVRPHRHRTAEFAYLGRRRRPMLEEAAYLLEMDGWRDRSRYLAAYVLPGSEYLQQKSRLGFAEQVRYLRSRLNSQRD